MVFGRTDVIMRLITATMTLKTPNTHKNELLLQRVFKIVVSATDLTPEFKLVFKAYINETIGDIRERGIASYHDLIDYLREKAEQGIDCNVWLTPEQKNYSKCVMRLLAELANADSRNAAL